MSKAHHFRLAGFAGAQARDDCAALTSGRACAAGERRRPESAALRAVARSRRIDVGGLGPADSALDLVSAWHLLEAGPRQVLQDDLRCGDLEWQRGKAWALQQSMGAVWYYVESNPTMSRMAQRTLARIAADTPSP